METTISAPMRIDLSALEAVSVGMAEGAGGAGCGLLLVEGDIAVADGADVAGHMDGGSEPAERLMAAA